MKTTKDYDVQQRVKLYDEEYNRNLLHNHEAPMQKQIVVDTLKAIMNVDVKDIYPWPVHEFGCWSATIRTEEIDFEFTYYAPNCWKIESFPVASISGDSKFSALHW